MEAKRELAVECMLYMDMKDGETKDEAYTRLLNILDKAKLEWGICECEEREK